MGKEIYLISDMYLAKDFIIRLLEKYGITISAENILLSGELGVSKKEGELWSYYKQKYVKQRSALHIGDNYHSDIENAEKEGISTYYIMKASEILNNSSLNVAEVHINGLNESVVIGMLCAKLFENPFCLNNTKGTVNYQEFEVLGYCWFGNVIITYLLWLQQQCVSLNIDQIIFLARDGFLLLEDYQFLMNQFEITDMHSSIYLPISRRLILIAAISDEKSFHEAISFPYIGRWEDYLFDRFDINILPDDEHRDDQINASADEYKIKEWLRVYSPQLQKVMNEEKVNYLRLLDGMGISENAGVVDVGYYGNTQHYLNRLLNQDLAGFYFSADLSIDNKCYTENRMFACFQSSEDMKANSCSLHKQSLVIESFLTAPYGMIKKIDTEGNCIYEPNRNSQSNFQDRLEMNEGVKAFIKDYSEILSGVDWRSIKLNTVFADKIYGILIENKGELSQKIKDSFYWDNGVVQRRESKIFE
jgi:predicted HAD superfamily hydrolase